MIPTRCAHDGLPYLLDEAEFVQRAYEAEALDMHAVRYRCPNGHSWPPPRLPGVEPEAAPRPESRPCAVCGSPMPMRQGNRGRKYCSQACSDFANRERMKSANRGFRWEIEAQPWYKGPGMAAPRQPREELRIPQAWLDGWTRSYGLTTEETVNGRT